MGGWSGALSKVKDVAGSAASSIGKSSGQAADALSGDPMKKSESALGEAAKSAMKFAKKRMAKRDGGKD